MLAAETHPDDDVRFIGDIPGCYSLSSRDSSDAGTVKVFACRTRSISATTVVLQAPITGQPGELIALHLEGLGLLRARINRGAEGGFIADLEVHGEHRSNLISRIHWLKQRRLRIASEKRHHKRWLPRDPRSGLVLADSQLLPCFIVDLSVSGVALSADLDPAVGTPIGVGSILGRVVRRLSCGFAVQFATPQTAEAVEHLLGSVTPARRRSMAKALTLASQDLPTSQPATE